MIRPFVQFYTTKRCNSNCRHCYLAALKNEKVLSYEDEMSTENTIKAFQKLRDMGFSLTSFGGAEPTQKMDFNYIVESVGKQGYQIKIHTNGTCIDTERAKALKRSNIFEVRISLDGSTPEINDFIRGEDAYRQSMIGIKNCVEQGLKTTVAITISKKNIKDLGNIIDLAHELKVAGVHSYLLIDKGRGKELSELILDENDKNEAKSMFELKRKVYDATERINRSECACKDGACYISLKQNGDVYLYEDSRAYFEIGVSNLGNIFDEDIDKKINDALLGKMIPNCNECPYYADFSCVELDNYCFDDIKF